MFIFNKKLYSETIKIVRLFVGIYKYIRNKLRIESRLISFLDLKTTET